MLVMNMWKLLLLATIIFHLSNSEIISKRKTIPISKETCPCWWDLEGKQIDPNTGEPFKCACCKKGKHSIQGLHLHSVSFSQILSGDDEGDLPMTHFCATIFSS